MYLDAGIDTRESENENDNDSVVNWTSAGSTSDSFRMQYVYMELRSFRLDLIEMAIAVVVVCNVRFCEHTHQLITIEENGQNPVTYWLRQLSM